MEVDEESRKYLVLSTHKGLFRYTRLPFGFHGAPAIFQAAIDAVLQGLPGVIAYLDDILVTGSDHQEHLVRLRALFTRLRTAGIRLKREKYAFCLSSITFLGHVIDASGTRPDPQKVKAILECPVPADEKQLRSFLGMANYYMKFVQNFSTEAAPLYKLTQVNVSYKWGTAQQTAFETLRKCLASVNVLTHYDPQ